MMRFFPVLHVFSMLAASVMTSGDFHHHGCNDILVGYRNEREEFLNSKVSWKERRVCYDEFNREYDCNLVKIIDEGFVLIEDLRLEGVFATHPKENFTTKRKKRKRNTKTPEVLMTGDPFEDLRTVRAMNMEGF